MHAKSGGSSGEPPDFLFIPAACRSRKDLPRSVGGGKIGRGTRATVCGTQKTGARARGAGDAGAGPRARARARAQGAGPRVRGAGRGCGTRKTRAWGAGRKTRNTWTRTRARARGHGHGGTGCRTQDAEHGLLAAGSRTRETRARGAGDGRRGTGDGAQAPVHGTQRDRIRPARPRNNRPGPFTAGRHPPPGPIRRDLSRLDARRRDPQQPAGAVHSRAPSAAGRRYLSRVRIRITPLPPRTPYMLLPRCTSTDLTS